MVYIIDQKTKDYVKKTGRKIGKLGNRKKKNLFRTWCVKKKSVIIGKTFRTLLVTL